MRFFIFISMLSMTSLAIANEVTRFKKGDCFLPSKEDVPSLTSNQRKVLCLKNKKVMPYFGAKPEFDIDILTNGENTIILLGERHVKSKRAHRAGEKILNEFSFRGLEGHEVRFRKASPSHQSPVIKQVLRLTMGQSNITTSKKDGVFLTKTRNKKTGKFENRIFINGKNKTANLAKEFGQNISSPYFFSEVYDSKYAQMPLNIHLERDTSVWKEIEQNCESFRKCEKYYIFELREKAMVKSIVQSFIDFKNKKIMAVVVGRAHNKGLRKILSCNYGYKIFKVTRPLSIQDAKIFGKLENNYYIEGDDLCGN